MIKARKNTYILLEVKICSDHASSISFPSSGSRASNLNTPLWSRGVHAFHFRYGHMSGYGDTSRFCNWLRSHFDEAVDDEVVCVPLQAAENTL